MNNKMREEFEEYISKETGYPLAFIKGQRTGSGKGYYNEFLDIPWRTWQASREAIVIELPDPYIETEVHGISEHVEIYRDACVGVIESAGIKCK